MTRFEVNSRKTPTFEVTLIRVVGQTLTSRRSQPLPRRPSCMLHFPGSTTSCGNAAEMGAPNRANGRNRCCMLRQSTAVDRLVRSAQAQRLAVESVRALETQHG